MECHSERFKIIRKYSSFSQSNALLINTSIYSSGSALPQYAAAPTSTKQKQAEEHPQRRQNKVQLLSQEGYQWELLNNNDKVNETQNSSKAETVNKLENIWKSGGEILRRFLIGFPPSQPQPAFPASKLAFAGDGGLYSSDGEDFSDGDDVPIPRLILDNAIDDNEIPLVRFYNNVVYFTKLCEVNYPAFRHELGSGIYNWAVPSKDKGSNTDEVGRAPSSYSYGHNIDPRKGKSTWLKSGVDLLKRRELKRRMSRVAGDSHKTWILNIALLSRFFIFLIQFLCRNLPSGLKHNNDGFKFTPEESYGKLLDPLVNKTLGGYVNWDAHYFLHISVYGYTSENIMAFFPLLPMTLYIPSRIVYAFTFLVLSLSSVVIICGVVLNTWLFYKCAENIYELAKMWSGGSQEFVTTACLMFSFNPASIFFSGLYTETLFAYLTSKVILSMFERNYWISLLCSAVSGLCRSNGILNVGFILALQLQREILQGGIDWHLGYFLIYVVLMVLTTAVPFLLFQGFGIKTFCDESILYDPGSVPLYCVGSWNLPYFYIQKKYWNVGFLEYFQLKQIPNFILAFPVLYILGTKSWTALRNSVIQMKNEWTVKHLYYTAQAIHGLFLTMFCFFGMHVQVSTRMIMAACPYLYTFVAESHVLELENFRKREITLPKESFGITLWCIIYFIIGSVGFSLGLPWT